MTSENARLNNHHKNYIHCLSLLVTALLLSACAQVPKESVELSTTVGRDVAEMHRSHKALATIVYARIKKDVNRFVDDVYAPFQIELTLKEYQADLSEAIRKASEPDPTRQAQKNAYEFLKIYVEELRNEIESYREELLAPIRKDRDQFLARLDASYQQIHYANSIVTGHLSSIVKVHDTQDELLAKAGLEGLRQESGKKLAEISDKVSKLVKDARRGNEKIDEAAKKLKDLVKKYEELKARFTDGE